MDGVLVDTPLLLREGLTPLLPGVTVLVEEDTDTPLKGETVILSAVTGNQYVNGGPGLGSVWTVSVVTLARSRERASDLAGQVFGAMHDLEGATVPGVGFISTVDTITLPARSPVTSVSNASTFKQFNAQFTVRVRPVAL